MSGEGFAFFCWHRLTHPAFIDTDGRLRYDHTPKECWLKWSIRGNR